ncbi:hypothetical protein NFI96_031821, partial [Prochilodus magdalenae]
MERSRAVLLTLVCVLFSRISGAEVEMRVRPGDNVTLYSDCVRESGTSVVWFRKSSDEDQTPLIISGGTLGKGAYSCCDLVRNPSLKTSDLLVRNVSESDVGLYYCAVREKKSINGVQRDVYHNGTRTTRLSLLELSFLFQTPLFLVLFLPPPPPPSRPPPPLLFQTVVSAGSCWSVCVLCVFSSPQSSPPPVCTVSTERDLKVGGGDVCYAALDLPSRGQKPLKKKKRRVESSEFSPYSECGWCAAGVLFSGISGSEVEMRVRPGDNVTLYSDCVWRIWEPVWLRNSSNEDQTPLIISTDTLIQAAFSRYYFVWNQVNQTQDLLVRSVSESDLGLYYCALWEKKFMTDGTGAEVRRDVYRYGNRTTRLSLL